MAISAPTRTPIEGSPAELAQNAHAAAAPTRFARGAHSPAAPNDESHHPAAYEGAPCRCLDEDDCVADHENE